MAGKDVPIYTGGGKKPPPKTTPPRGSSSSTKKPGSSSSKKKASDPYAKAQAAQNKKEAAAKKKAGEKYLEGAANLEVQAIALRDALKTEFARARDNNLGDIDKVLNEQLALLKEQHGLRAQDFMRAADSTEKAAGDQAGQNFSNLVRERADSMTAVLEQGAGETDTMRAMLMSARNWHANASEGNRSYFDTMQSVNAGITDLNVDTKTALANAASTAEADRERIWQDYYNRRSEAWTQLGNVKGQQADYYAQAKEMGVKPKTGAEKAAEKEMKDAFAASANESGKSYTNQGLPEWIQEYKGTEQVQARQENTKLEAAMVFEPVKKAEGATLRKWAS